MDILFTLSTNDFDESWQRSKRPSVRGIIIKSDKLAMVYSTRDDYYKFPGGGIENEEDHRSTLIREVKEETGLNVIPSSINEFGEAILLRKSDFLENTIFEQENFYYFCNTEDDISSQQLDDYEMKAGFTLNFVTAEEAIQTNLKNAPNDPSMMLEREAKVLQLLLDSGYINA